MSRKDGTIMTSPQARMLGALVGRSDVALKVFEHGDTDVVVVLAAGSAREVTVVLDADGRAKGRFRPEAAA